MGNLHSNLILRLSSSGSHYRTCVCPSRCFLFLFLVSQTCLVETGKLASSSPSSRFHAGSLLTYLARAVLLAGVLVHAPESSRAPFCLSSTVRTFSSSSTSTSKHFHLELLKLWMEGFCGDRDISARPTAPHKTRFLLGSADTGNPPQGPGSLSSRGDKKFFEATSNTRAQGP